MTTTIKPDPTKPAEDRHFVLAMPAAFWWTVRIPVPSENDYQHCKLDVLFEPLSQKQLDRMRGIGLDEGEQPPTDEAIARKVIKNWRGMKGPDGVDLPFNDEALGHLLLVPLARTAIVATYFTVMSGIGARKNA
jgi:hypothetical protein